MPSILPLALITTASFKLESLPAAKLTLESVVVFTLFADVQVNCFCPPQENKHTNSIKIEYNFSEFIINVFL
ncbi:MAG: hypothetical protein WA839_01890 [Flavobacteriaceae bacterium]